MWSLWLPYEFAINMIENYLIFFFLKDFYVKRTESKLLIATILVFQSFIVLLLNLYFGSASLYSMAFILFIYSILYACLFKNRIITLILMLLLALFIIIVFDGLGGCVVSIIFNVSPIIIGEYNIYRIVSGIGSRILLFIFLLFIKKYKLSPKYIKKIYIYELIIILMLSILFLFLVFNVYQGKLFLKSSYFIGIITLCIVLFSYIVMKLIHQISLQARKEAEWILQEEEYKRQIEYVKKIQDLIYNLKAERHDFNHQIGCIYGLLENAEVAEAKEYVKKVVKEKSQMNTIINIENPVIAALLNYKLTIAIRKKIEVDFKVVLPKDISISPMDISVLLGNALDNAIEASEKANEKFIRVELYIEEKYLIIKIANTKNKTNKCEGDLRTTKKDKENHGFGIESMKYIVKKYNGLIKISEEDLFELNIALLME